MERQILYVNVPIDVETILKKQAYLKAIFYTSNLVKNAYLLRFNHLIQIFIDKPQLVRRAI